MAQLLPVSSALSHIRPNSWPFEDHHPGKLLSRSWNRREFKRDNPNTRVRGRSLNVEGLERSEGYSRLNGRELFLWCGREDLGPLPRLDYLYNGVLLQVSECPVCHEKAPVFSGPIKEPVSPPTKILRTLIVIGLRPPIKLAWVAVLFIPTWIMENGFETNDRLMNWLRNSFPICPDHR
jgi:hypothetical protein